MKDSVAVQYEVFEQHVTVPYASACFQEVQDKVISPEKAEEAKLKARYPNIGHKPGGSDLLRKRLQKGVSSVCLQNTQGSLEDYP